MHLIEQIQNQSGSNQLLINEQGFNKTRIIIRQHDRARCACVCVKM